VGEEEAVVAAVKAMVPMTGAEAVAVVVPVAAVARAAPEAQAEEAHLPFSFITMARAEQLLIAGW
jgi:hypothetical protein